MTVMSSSAPSAPITMPPRTSPLRSTFSAPIWTSTASSVARPENSAQAVNTLARTTVRASAAKVPSSATVVIVLKPWAR